ncbi:MAG: TonB-dependent receptor [Chitinophaga sp.]|nr:TonB-dependent receptor [Chitinophaga sp.]
MGGGARGGAGRGGANATIGHFYGKIVDSKSNKGVPGATVVLTGNKFDTVTKQMKQGVTIKTVISQNNGDFSLENLPLFGNFKLKISAIGYKAIEKQVSFDIKMPQGGANNSDAMSQVLSAADKDLGNIKIESEATDLGTVTVTATKPQLELGIDRKVFNVDKNLTSTGQTATEVMKSIPSVSVDIDGNVTLRNATPTIFVDGRPTTMTLDQIPADIIDKVEIITNPSAKYDASGGNAGILNIVLKKNKKVGYNGGLRAGIDSRAKVNLGGDINLRQQKTNLFLSGNFNQRKSLTTSITNYNNAATSTTPASLVYNNSDGVSNGYFGFLRGGFDYFLDNRNTISVTGNYVRGSFDNDQPQTTDSIVSGSFLSHTNTYSTSSSVFKNYGGQLSFRHNFEKNGHDITADINYNNSNNNSNSNTDRYSYIPYSFTLRGFPNNPFLQQSLTNGSGNFFTAQIDYENPISETSKFEAGTRAQIRNNANTNNLYKYDSTSKTYLQSVSSSSNYKFTDAVYAAYSTYTFKANKFNFQLGLRAESSSYTGTLVRSTGDTSFNVKYPLSLFPSVFITYKLTDKQDLQFNYSRRVNRPNFFQLTPFPDYSTAPVYVSIGNAGLRPEFTYSFEMNYNYSYAKNSNLLISTYFKYNTDLITRYVYNGKSDLYGDILYYSYINASSGYSYGLEITDKMPVTKWWDVTANVNFFNSQLNVTIPGQATSISNSLLSMFSKMNNNIKLGKGFSLQISSEWRSKTLLPQSGGSGGMGGRGGGMGGMFGGGQQTLAQGYILPRNFDADVAIKKDWTWKNGQSGSLTLSMNDIFKTSQRSYSEALNFTQYSERFRDPQVLRLNFSYRFGKFDANLFKRKNTKAEQGVDMGGINQQ